MKYLLVLPFLLINLRECYSQSDEIVMQKSIEYLSEKLTYPESLEILNVKMVGILTFRNLIDKVILDWDDKDGKTEGQWDNISYNIKKDLHEQLTITEDAAEEPFIYSYRYKITFRAKNNFGKVMSGDKHITLLAYPPYNKEMWYGRENVIIEHSTYKFYFDAKIESLTQ